MNKFLTVLLLPLTICIAASAQDAPAAANKSNRTMGEVTAIDGSSLTIKPDSAGDAVTVALDPATKYLRVPPKEPDLKKAVKINPSEIGVGDRVLAVTRAAADAGKPAMASTIVVMTKEDLAKKQEADRSEWQRRGVSGTVTAVDTAKNEITVDTRTREGKKAVTVDASAAKVRRYAPDSIRFSDAKPSSIAELKVGDQLRILGDKSADESGVKAQEIVGGTFHNIAGTVLAIDANSGEIKITNLETKKPMTVKVNPDSTLRRLPQQLAYMLASRTRGGGASGAGMQGAPGGAGAGSVTPGEGGPRFQRPGGAGEPGQAGNAGQWRRADGAAGPGGPGAGGPGGPAGAGGPGGPGGFGGGGGFGRGAASGDLSQMIERLPALQLSELKTGDAIVVASTAGSDPTRATAITVLAGVEPLLTAPRQQDGRALGGQWNFDINIVPQ